MKAIVDFLQSIGHATVQTIQPLGEGMFSRAYRFDTKDGSFVLRIGVSREAFEKDQLAYERLGHMVRIPKVSVIGAYTEGQFYAITNWQPGRRLDRIRRSTTLRILPNLFTSLLAMSRVPVPPETGFGILNGTGQSRRHYNTWADFIGAIDDFAQTFLARSDEMYKPWTELLTTTTLDKTLVHDARRRLTELLPYLPNARHYIHGDFGFDNALTDGYRLTAILDWAELRIGDWLHDLAYVAYHDRQGIDYIGAFRQWADANGLAVPNLSERIRANYLHIFLGNIFLEANRGMWDWYREDVERYRRLIASESFRTSG